MMMENNKEIKKYNKRKMAQIKRCRGEDQRKELQI